MNITQRIGTKWQNYRRAVNRANATPSTDDSPSRDEIRQLWRQETERYANLPDIKTPLDGEVETIPLNR